MKWYSKNLVYIGSWFLLKTKGAIALYRVRSLIKNIGPSSRCPRSVDIKYPENISIGDHVLIGPQTTIGGFGTVIIEDYVRISKGVVIETAGLNLTSGLPYTHKGKPRVIKKGAWLGTRCVILAGVTVGEQAVIGAGAIVTKDVPPHAIVVYNSAKVIGDIRA